MSPSYVAEDTIKALNKTCTSVSRVSLATKKYINQFYKYFSIRAGNSADEAGIFMLKGLQKVAHTAKHNNWHKSRNQKSSLRSGRGMLQYTDGYLWQLFNYNKIRRYYALTKAWFSF